MTMLHEGIHKKTEILKKQGNYKKRMETKKKQINERLKTCHMFAHVTQVKTCDDIGLTHDVT